MTCVGLVQYASVDEIGWREQLIELGPIGDDWRFAGETLDEKTPQEKRKLENSEQRLARQSHQSSPEIPEFAG